MNNIKTAVLSRESMLTVILTGIAAIAPLIHSQLITGTIVNAVLLIAVMIAGFRAAAVVAIVPSLIALTAGTLPAAMAAMIPYIMISNIVFAGLFAILRKFNYWLAAGIASIIKFVMLTLGAIVILEAVTKGNLGLALTSMMGWPQLVTAILAAILVWLALKEKLIKRA